MDTIYTRALAALPDFKALCADVAAGRTPAALTGLGHIHKALLIHALCGTTNRPALVLTGDEAEASRLAEDLCAMGTEALVLPARDLALRQVEAAARDAQLGG